MQRADELVWSGMATVFRPDSERLTDLGYESVSHVPVLFDSEGRYCREYNRYLRERATVRWTPENSRGHAPSESTMLSIAHWLTNWIEWCEQTGVTFESATYDDVLRYQKDQQRGDWSSTGKPIAGSTINTRADEIVSCLTWGATNELRGAFVVRRISASVPARSIGGGVTLPARTVLRRVGRLKETGGADPDAFNLPTPKEVKAWLHAVRERRGRAKYLCCRFILECGPRRGEVEALTVRQWPERAAIDEALAKDAVFVPMKLWVTKGKRPRTIKVPVGYADEVRQWIDTARTTMVFRGQRRTGKRPDGLFVSDSPGFEGTPIRAQTIYDCFHEVEPRPAKWAPHKGRHAFACFFVLHALEMEARAERSTVKGMGVDWVTNRGEWWLKTLQRQFGHTNPQTTEIYLHWLVSAVQLTDLANGWHLFLNAEDEP